MACVQKSFALPISLILGWSVGRVVRECTEVGGQSTYSLKGHTPQEMLFAVLKWGKIYLAPPLASTKMEETSPWETRHCASS